MSLTNQTPESQVQSLFKRVAANYDQMNNLISLGTHKHWRKVAMASLAVKPGSFVLDLCCGTGDWTVALAKAVGPSGQVVGLDFSKEMLCVAKEKVASAGFNDRVTLVQGDAMALPYDNNHFDVITIGFGLRNVPDADQVLREMYRVVRPGGQAASLETSQPTQPVIKLGWKIYFKLIPMMTRLVVHNYQDYVYLEQTAANFVNAEQLADMYANAGFNHIDYQTFDMGAAAFHSARKSYTPA